MRRLKIFTHGPAQSPLRLILGGLALCLAVFAYAQGDDTLYLRDGSVLKGDIVKDTLGDYLVFNKYGGFSIAKGDVLYYSSASGDEATASETYIIIEKTHDAVAVLQRDVPEREDDAKSFNLLVAGTVEAVTDGSQTDIPFETKDLAGMTRLTIQYAHLLDGVDHVYVTTRQRDLLKEDEKGRLRFRQDYVLDTEGRLKILLKYPTDWKIDSIVPEPSRRYDGLVVWETTLKRQQNFSAVAEFDTGQQAAK